MTPYLGQAQWGRQNGSGVCEEVEKRRLTSEDDVLQATPGGVLVVGLCKISSVLFHVKTFSTKSPVIQYIVRTILVGTDSRKVSWSSMSLSNFLFLLMPSVRSRHSDIRTFVATWKYRKVKSKACNSMTHRTEDRDLEGEIWRRLSCSPPAWRRSADTPRSWWGRRWADCWQTSGGSHTSHSKSLSRCLC